MSLSKIIEAIEHPDFALPALVFVWRKDDAERLAGQLQGLGVCGRVAYVHGSVQRSLRKQYAEQMQAGELDLVVATDAWATGLDIPRLRSVVMANGGRALVGLKQRSGRGARLDAGSGKDSFTIFDIGQVSFTKDARGSPERAVENQKSRMGGYEQAGYPVEARARNGPQPGVGVAEFERDTDLEQMLAAKAGATAGTEEAEEYWGDKWPVLHVVSTIFGGGDPDRGCGIVLMALLLLGVATLVEACGVF